MSKEVAKEVAMKAKRDSAFLDAILKDAETALHGYDLTPKEMEFFRKTDRMMLEGLSERCFELDKNIRSRQTPK